MQQEEEVIPEWITVKLLRRAIRSYKNDDSVEVEDFFIKSGFCEHVASALFQCRIDLKYANSKCETLNVIVKARPTIVGGLKAIASEGPLFENEIRMYSNTLPEFNNLFKRVGLNIDLAPEFIYATDNPFPIIILKDLSTERYFAPRFPFDDVEHSKQIIRRLAQFHAASFYLREMNELDFHDYKYNVYENEPLIHGMYDNSIKVFQEVIGTWDGYQEYIPKLSSFMEHIGEIGRKVHTFNKSTGYNVLNHGDFHLRNTLVKLDTEKGLEKFCFIDYQVTVYGSPAIDLNFVWGHLKRDVNGDLPYEDIVVFYHQEFVKTLHLFKFPKSIPSLVDLNVELIRHGHTNVMMLIVYTPLEFVDWSKNRLEDFLETDEKANNFKKSLYNLPICKAIMERSLKSFVHKGWL